MQNQAQATKEFNESIIKTKEMLQRLTAASKKNFSTDPNKANWGELSDIKRIEIALKEICDSVFNEGEFAR